MWHKIKDTILINLFAGLTVLIPLYLTFYILASIVELFDRLLDYPPMKFIFDANRFTGLGILLVLAIAILSGILVRHFIGRNLVSFFNQTIERIPIVASIYGLLRQVSESMLGQSGKSFSRVVLVEWPRKEIWTIGFVTGTSSTRITARVDRANDWINVFIPTTPNPTSGFYFMVKNSDVRDLDISVEQAFKVIISGGALSVDTHVKA